MNSSDLLKKQIHKELDFLCSNFNENSERVREIVQLFIEETPALLDRITGAINSKRWREAGTLVHKIKTRYNYIGLDDIACALAVLQEDIQDPTKEIISLQAIDLIKEKTNEVIHELKNTTYYQQKEKQVY